MLIAIFGWEGTHRKVIKQLGGGGPLGSTCCGLKMDNGRPTSCVLLLVAGQPHEFAHQLKDWLFKSIRFAMHPKHNTIQVFCSDTQDWVAANAGIELPMFNPSSEIHSQEDARNRYREGKKVSD